MARVDARIAVNPPPDLREAGLAAGVAEAARVAGAPSMTVAADVADAAGVEAAAGRVVSAFRRTDVLVTSAQARVRRVFDTDRRA